MGGPELVVAHPAAATIPAVTVRAIRMLRLINCPWLVVGAGRLRAAPQFGRLAPVEPEPVGPAGRRARFRRWCGIGVIDDPAGGCVVGNPAQKCFLMGSEKKAARRRVRLQRGQRLPRPSPWRAALSCRVLPRRTPAVVAGARPGCGAGFAGLSTNSWRILVTGLQGQRSRGVNHGRYCGGYLRQQGDCGGLARRVRRSASTTSRACSARAGWASSMRPTTPLTAEPLR